MLQFYGVTNSSTKHTMGRIKTRYFIPFVCNIFIFLFVYTALSKLQQFHQFEAVLQKSPLLQSSSEAIAWILPTTELLVAALLFIPNTRRIGFYSSAALMIIFTVYISYMIVFTPHLPCSCGGVIKQMSWKQHLLFNLALTALSLFAIVIDSKHPLPGKQVTDPARPNTVDQLHS